MSKIENLLRNTCTKVTICHCYTLFKATTFSLRYLIAHLKMTERQWYAVKHTKTFSLWNSNFEKINGQVSSIHRSEKPEFSSSKLSLLSLLLPKGKLMLLIKWRDKNLMIFLGQWGNYGCWLHWYRGCQYCHDWGCWKHSSRSGPYEIGWCFQSNLYTIDFNCPNNYRKCLIFLPTKILIFATKYVNRICIWDFFGLFSKILGFFVVFFGIFIIIHFLNELIAQIKDWNKMVWMLFIDV